MATTENELGIINGFYRDVITVPDGRVVWDSEVRKNKIVTNCRLLLASFMRGDAQVMGIQSLKVGSGLASWDVTLDPIPDTLDALVDSNPYEIQAIDLEFSYLDKVNGLAVTGPTNILQVRATLGPGKPDWPKPGHPTSSLREFGLFGKRNGTQWMINSVRHPAIVKDAVSTLTRTLWLVF